MKKSTLISIVALLVSIVGLATALAVFFKKRHSNNSYELGTCDDDEYDFSECCDGNCCEYITCEEDDCYDECSCGDCTCESDDDDIEVEIHEITNDESDK